MIMKKNLSKKNVLALGCALALSVAALSVPAARAEVGASAEFGTTGFGAHVTLPTIKNLNARIGANAFNYSRSGSASKVDYNFNLQMRTIDLLADYYPLSSDVGFRLTGGLVYNGTEIEVHAKPKSDQTFTLNGTTYTSGDVGRVQGDVSFRKIAPYVGVGWGNALAKDSKWSFTADLGALFMGSPETSLHNTGCAASAATCARLADDIKVEQHKLDNKSNGYTVYPVLRVGVSYKF